MGWAERVEKQKKLRIMKHKIINVLKKTFRILINLLSRFPLKCDFIKSYLHLPSIHLAFKNDFIIFLSGRCSIIFQPSVVVKPLHEGAL